MRIETSLSRVLGEAPNSSDRDARKAALALIGSLGFGLVLAILSAPEHWPAVCMWASACAMVGMLLGFIFGIPRFLARSGATAAVTPAIPVNPAQGDPATAVAANDPSSGEQPTGAAGGIASGEKEKAVQADDRSASARKPSVAEVNTNLEEISDWLTKIIVGVSLVELHSVQQNLREASSLIAQTLGKGSYYDSLAYGLMMYFAIVGFLGSYLLTRLYLQKAFREAAR